MPPIICAIKGFPGYYVGSNGGLWSKWRTRGRVAQRGVESYIGTSLKPMKPRKHNGGYLSAALRKEGKYYYFLMHRLVLETFVGPCPEGMEALHGDGDRHNNRVSNLRWGTKEENVQDAIRHGTFYNGTKAAAFVTKGVPRPPEVRKRIREGHMRRDPEVRKAQMRKANDVRWGRADATGQ